MKEWSDYLDENSLVVQKEGDGGDSLNRTSASYLLAHWNQDYAIAVRFGFAVTDLGSPDMAKYRRSLHPGMWYSNFDRTSRDQLIPLVIMLGAVNDGTLNQPISWVLIDHFKRGLLFTYNTRKNFVYPTLEEHLEKSTPDVPWDYRWKLPDFTGPEFWALYIRGFKAWYLYPLLYLFDLETLVGSILTRFNKKKDDVINHALVLEYGKRRMDTFVMKLARWINPRPLLQERLDRFFGKEIEPPINELYRSLK